MAPFFSILPVAMLVLLFFVRVYIFLNYNCILIVG